MAGVQLTGMASGMDTDSIIEQMMEIQREPIYQKYEEIQNLEEEKTEWKAIDTKLSELNSAVSDLQFSSTFNSKTVSSSDDTIAGATAKTSAGNVSYTLENITLAQAGKVSSSLEMTLLDGEKAGVESSVDSTITDPNQRFTVSGGISSGSFEINGQTITVDEDDTINLVITKINGSGANVNASFDKLNNKFIIEADEVGDSYDIDFGDDSDTSGFLAAVGMGTPTVIEGVDADYQRPLADVIGLPDVEDGFFTINGFTFEVDATEDTISSIVTDINQSEAGVVVFFDNDSKKFNITSKEAGEDIILENDTSNFLTSMNIMNGANDTDDSAEKSVYEGTNASVTINGVEFTKSSNEFEINGVNIKLKTETEAGEKVTLNVASNTDTAVEKIEAFVAKYNDVIQKLELLTAKEALFQGDSTVNNLIYRLRNQMTNKVNGVDSEYNTLSMVGIRAESSSSSQLTLNKSDLIEALKENPSAVEELFSKDIGTGLIEGESVGTGNGTTVTFDLEGVPIGKEDLVIIIDGVEFDASKILTENDTPDEDEIYLDLNTGKITFGTAPEAGKEISITYNVDNSKSSDGIAVRLESYLKPYTRYNGTIDSSVTSYDKRIEDMNEWIVSMNLRLTMREDSMRSKFSAMEIAMSTANSQSQWLSGQTSSLG